MSEAAEKGSRQDRRREAEGAGEPGEKSSRQDRRREAEGAGEPAEKASKQDRRREAEGAGEPAEKASKQDRRREDGRSSRSRPRARRRSERRSASRSRRRRRRERRSRSRSRSALQRQEQRERREREERREQEERKQREPSAVVLVHGIPETGVSEECLEKVAWDMAVKAGCSMPNSVQFQFEEGTHTFRGSALVEFPHKDAAKLFKEHAKDLLEIDGFNLALKYHHPATERSRSRSWGREMLLGRDRDEPSVTIMIKGISSTTSEATLAATFQPFATIKDIRHFPRRGFAFVQFHSIDEATTALNRFDKECRSRLDGERVIAHFAKEREDVKLMAERSFLQQQALVAAEATAELEKLAAQKAQNEIASKALSGVNAEMWANYMQSVAQTETVQSANTFQFDKESGYYLDSKAGLFYDPNTTYFFTTDCKKYFIYDHDEKLLCLVDSQGQKVPGGERRELPSQASKPRARDADRERERNRERDREKERERELREQRERRRSRSRRRDRSRSRSAGRRRERSHSGDRRDRNKDPPQPEPARPSLMADGRHKPIHFPGGDPLARLAPEPAPKSTPQPKKKKKPPDGVLGLAPLTDPKAVAVPGPVTVFKPKRPGPVTVFQPAAGRGSAGGQAVGAADALWPAEQAGRLSGSGLLTAAALAGPGAAAAPPPGVEEWICEVCMRKFATEDGLRRHEQLSDLHRENLAKLRAAI